MKDLLLRALDTARLRGASYADARFVDEERQIVLVKDGRVEAVTSDRSRGIGVRVIANGGWGFAASSRLGARDIDMAAAAAVRLAKASSTALRAPVDIGEPAPVTASYATPVFRDPFAVDLSEKVALLTRASDEMRRVKGVAVASASTEIGRIRKLFASTEGSYIEQDLVETGCLMEATAVGGGEVQNRSYPNSVGRHMGDRGLGARGAIRSAG